MKPVFDKQAYDKQYRIDHGEERRVRATAYNAAHKKEAAAYRAAHKEEMRAYRAAHSDEICAQQAAYYEANRDATLEESARFHEWLQVLRANNGCEDCGTHEGRLDHHHVDPATKRRNVSDMCRYSLDTIEDELEKCVVLCDSGHKERHVALRANARAAA